MSQYDDLLAAGADNTAPASNPYEAIVDDEDRAQKQALAATLQSAVQTNPDQYSTQRRVAGYLGYPVAAVVDRPELAKQAQVQQVQQAAQTNPVLARKYTDADFAKLAHDDSTALSSVVDSAWAFAKYLASAPDSEKTLMGDIGAGVRRADAGAAGAFRAVSELAAVPLDFLEANTPEQAAGWRGRIGGNPLRRLAEGFGLIGNYDEERAKQLSPESSSFLMNSVSSGVQSLAQNTLTMPLALLPGGEAAALYGMAGQAGGASYQNAREAGVGQWQSLGYGLRDAVVESATEKTSLHKLLGDLQANAGLGKALLYNAITEVPGEQVATILQDLNEWATLHPEKPFSDYLAERPNAAAQTLIATLIGVGGNVAVMHGVNKVAQRAGVEQQWVDQAQNSAQMFKDLQALADATKLSERSPEHLQSLLHDATDGALARFDAASLVEAFNQAGINVNDVLPNIGTEELMQQAASGGEVSAPLSEVVTAIRGTPLEQTLPDIIRFGDNEMSAAEAKQAAGELQEKFKRDFEAAAAQAQDAEAFRASAETVRATIQQQLEEAGRYRSQVNEAMSHWVGAFYATMAQRIGMTPEEMYQRYPLRVLGEAQSAGQVMDQGDRTGALTVEGYHYSKTERPIISTGAFGTGLEGSGREGYLNAEDKRLRKRSYFYVDKGTGINPEPGVGGIGHKVSLSNVYDADADPLRLKEGRDPLGFEAAVLDKGYSGYLSRMDGTQSGQAIMLGDQTFKPEVLGPLGKTNGAVVPKPAARQAFGRDVTVDALNAQAKNLPQGSPTRERWAQLLEKAMPQEYAALKEAGVFDGKNDNLYLSELVKEFKSKTAAPVYEQSLSSRLPSAVKATEDPLTDVLHINFDTVLSDSKTLEKNVAALQETPNMRKLKGKGAKDPVRNVEAFIDHAVGNLLWLHDHMPAEMRDRARLWYDGGRKTVEAWAKRYGISEMQGAAAIAVLSPQNDWFTNVSQAERIADAIFGARDFQWDDAMSAEAARILGDKADEKMDAARGKTLAEVLGQPDVAARWVRVYDQAHNSRHYRVLTPEGGAADYVKTGSGTEAVAAWKTYTAIAKAISVFTDGRAENVHYQIGKEHKVRNFYNNIFDPKSPLGFATIDTHAVAAALLRPLAGGDTEVIQAFGGAGSASSALTGLNGTYPIYLEAYRRAAEQRGLQPREMQSITWEAVRGLFEAAQKSRMKASADAIWGRYKKGEIEQAQAQQEILALAGDITPPSWTEVPFNDAPGRTYEGPAQKAVDERTAKAQEPTASKVMFEVAPDPSDAELTARWNALSNEERLRLSQEVAAAVVPKVLAELGTDGDFVMQMGGYMGATNPSMTLRVDRPELAIQAAKLLGHALSQDSMMVVSDSPIVGADSVGAVTIALPDGYGVKEIEALYDRLWELQRDGEHLVGGHTTADGQMAILNYSPLSTEELAQAIFDHLGGEFDVTTDTVYSAFPGKDDYGFGQTDTPEGAATGQSPAQRRPSDLRAEATQQLREALDARAEGRPQEVLKQDGPLLAPNGKPSKLSPKLHAIVRTTAFKNWFGDWEKFATEGKTVWEDANGEVSKVVDENGEPLVVYHGTDAAGFDQFNRPGGERRGDYGIFASPDWNTAASYVRRGRAREIDLVGDDGGNVYAMFMNIRNPLEAYFEGANWDGQRAGKYQVDDENGEPVYAEDGTRYFATREDAEVLAEATPGAEVYAAEDHYETTDGVAREARKYGNDGAIIHDVLDDGGGATSPFDPATVYVAFEPEQLKSVQNFGAFDPSNPSILAQQARGTFNPNTLELVLSPTADLSTWFHESGHFYLEVLADIASQPNAPQQIVDDYNTIMKWFGVDPASWSSMSIDEKRAYHERFAESFEQYVMEGKAPSTELQPFFRRFRAWLLSVYKSIKAFLESRGVVTSGTPGALDQMPHDRRLALREVHKARGVEFTDASIDRGSAHSPAGPDSGSPAYDVALNGTYPEDFYGPDGLRYYGTGEYKMDAEAYSHIARLAGHPNRPVRVYRAVEKNGPKKIAPGDWVTPVRAYAKDHGDGALNGDYKIISTSVYARDIWTSGDSMLEWGYHPQALMPEVKKDENGNFKSYLQGTPPANASNIQLNADVRRVFDRMLATDEQIQQANEIAGLVPNEEADAEASDRLQRRSMADLKWTVNARDKAIKALTKQAKEIEKGVRAQVTEEVNQMPEVQAKAKLDELRKTKQLDDASTAAVADAFGFESVDKMLQTIDAFGSKKDVIDAFTSQRMLEDHGELVDERAIREAANDAVHNEARARSLATELRTQAELLNPRRDTGKVNAAGSRVTVNALAEAAKQFGQRVADNTVLRDLKSKVWQHTQAERRAGAAWRDATAKGDTQAAVKAKQDQMLQNAAAKATLEAQAEAKKVFEFFKRIVKGNDETVVEKGRDPDIVNAARAVLAAYGVETPTTKQAADYLELVKKNDPETYNVIAPSVEGALRMAQPLESLTVEQMRGLHEELQALWHLAKRSRQMEVDGNLMDIADAAGELHARMVEYGIPDTIPGETGALTNADKRKRWLQFAGALLRRVEQWSEKMDGKYGGPFLRYVFQPIKDAAEHYRSSRFEYRKEMQAIFDKVGPTMTHKLIEAPELGYTFGKGHNGIGHAELLHAILHTGNESNLRKLLLGRGWGEANPDGTVNRAKWDGFINRLVQEGVLTREHFDFAQSIWDLMEKTKPLAQRAHRDVFGRYFNEVTADAFVDPFGVERRGGYVPAQADPMLTGDADVRALAELENENMAYSFPATSKGFTKSRVEYNRPLKLDLRTLPQHIDKVLLFSHMEPAVRGATKLLRDKGVSQALYRIAPSAYSGMLLPWLNRSARQIVETPIPGDGGVSRVLSALYTRSGAALMFGNISNAIQQVTGFSSALVKVGGAHMMRANAQFIAHPKQMIEAVKSQSEFMRNRMDGEIAHMTDTIHDIILNPNLYEKSQAWTQRNAYFLQQAIDNTMGPIIWTAAYNQALEQGMEDRMAVRFADGVIRQTLQATAAEDVSRIETGPAYARLFTQFAGYFNMLANTNATALQQIAKDMGLRKGAGKALGVVFFGTLAPIWIAEAIAQAFKGGPDDKDHDGYLDDWLAAVFGMGTIKGVLAYVPFVGQLASAGIGRFTANPTDDKMSLSPAVGMLESSAGVAGDVYQAINGKLNAKHTVEDLATLVSLATGLPARFVARPLGYAAGVAQGKIEPTSPADAARGLATGAASPESRQR